MNEIQNPFTLILSKLETIEQRLATLQANKPTDKPAAERHLSRQEAADYLHCSLPTLNTWVLKGTVKGHRIGRYVRFKQRELDESLIKINVGK